MNVESISTAPDIPNTNTHVNLTPNNPINMASPWWHSYFTKSHLMQGEKRPSNPRNQPNPLVQSNVQGQNLNTPEFHRLQRSHSLRSSRTTTKERRYREKPSLPSGERWCFDRSERCCFRCNSSRFDNGQCFGLESGEDDKLGSIGATRSRIITVVT